MSQKKMSYAVVVEKILNGEEMTDEMRERLEALKASLEKRASRKSEGPTKAQKENAELAERIYEQMTPSTIYSNADIASLLPELDGATPQKLSPLMKILDGRVIIEKVKGKATYRLA